MNLKYMPEIDTLYIYLDAETPKVLVPSSFNENIGVFLDKKTRKVICGYEIELAKEFLLNNINKFQFNLKQLLAIGIYFSRITRNMSQEAMATEIGISLSTFKKLEKAEQNLTLENFEIINKKVPTKIKKLIAESLLAS